MHCPGRWPWAPWRGAGGRRFGWHCMHVSCRTPSHLSEGRKGQHQSSRGGKALLGSKQSSKSAEENKSLHSNPGGCQESGLGRLRLSSFQPGKKKRKHRKKERKKKKADCIYPNLPGEDKGFPNEMSLVQTFSCQSKSKISFGNAWFLTVFDKAERMG